MKEMFVIGKYAREVTLTYSGGRAKNAQSSTNLTEINAYMIWKISTNHRIDFNRKIARHEQFLRLMIYALWNNFMSTKNEISPNISSNNCSEALRVARLIGCSLAVVGFVLNYLCFLAARCMPESSSATLMKYLAVWDSLASFADGVLHLGLQVLGFDITTVHVSLLNFAWFS